VDEGIIDFLCEKKAPILKKMSTERYLTLGELKEGLRFFKPASTPDK
jgi:hypothetical protein